MTHKDIMIKMLKKTESEFEEIRKFIMSEEFDKLDIIQQRSKINDLTVNILLNRKINKYLKLIDKNLKLRNEIANQ